MAKKSGGGDAKSMLSFLAMVALIAYAVIVIINWALKWFGTGSSALSGIMSAITAVALIIGLIFIAIYAYNYASRKGQAWVIVFWICAFIAILFIFMGIFG